MSKITSNELRAALDGEKGTLFTLLESHTEGEIREAILSLESPQETLRDKFAARAMQAALTAGHDEGMRIHEGWRDEFARESYRYADAMLKAREEKP